MANSYLNRTISSSPTNPDKFTISMWVKKAGQGAEQVLLGSYASSNFRAKLQFKSDDKLEYYQVNDGGATAQVRTTRLFRDSNAFYHLVVQFDTSQNTASDRIKIYINNVQETAFDISSYPAQDLDMRLNQASQTLSIGQDGNSGNYFNGYISHLALADGQTYAPTVFGETDSTSGIWKFKSPTGVTWGDDGFHLKFENSANLGLDSANTNNFTVNGNLKQALDTPSNVYTTLNPLTIGATAVTLGNGNNSIVGGAANAEWYTASTIAPSKGKWYLEIRNDFASGQSADMIVGFTTNLVDVRNEAFPGKSSHSLGLWSAGTDVGDIKINNSVVSNQYTGDWGSANKILGMALDLDNKIVYFSIDGVWQSSGNPSSGTGGYDFSSSLTPFEDNYFIAIGSYYNSLTINKCSVNFGNGLFGTTAITSAGSNGNGSLFEYDCPTGYYALNTKNINTYG